MTIENVYKTKDGTGVHAVIDGVEYTSLPLEVDATYFRDENEVPSETPTWTSPNRFRQMIADEFENRGIEIPDYTPTPEDQARDHQMMVAAVKAEAGRRILEIMPTHEQMNTLATGMELIQTKGPNPSSWSQGDRQRHQEAMTKWAMIKNIRAKSNQIEQMEPIPDDFRDDSYWT